MISKLEKSILFQDDSNEDNLDACLSKTSKTLGQCILDCDNDSSCETACVSIFKDEHSECPCQVCGFDLNGVNIILQEKCPLGCPCDDYDCDLPEKKAILTLYSRTSSTPPVLIQPNGKYLTLVSGLISIKVVSLKILNSKSTMIQKFTHLALRH